jgi:hypothetical protein
MKLNEDSLSLFAKLKPLLTVSNEAINEVSYMEKKGKYGIIITLKGDLKKLVKIHSAEGEKFLRGAFSHTNQTLTLNYFSKRSFDSLQDYYWG